MSIVRLTLGAALAGVALAGAPAAFAQQSTVTKESATAIENMKSDAIMKNAEESLKDKPKSMPDMSKESAKPMKDEMDKDKKMGMGMDKKDEGK